ncbi:HDOD domain-containing protein [Ectothiorhodospira shaposhnikovii]|uniref:HDOD domain-containing protein n=1 Tax=Ectothiorhodospira shaposhnikovii TaxID=1054 RepID=UPI001EE978D1|nr:HDOD domain-containing protein [Ectothiorhodospira shaposhnikovii]MCG5514115.1 HDOD domain-containing protein [Ectothiorhodospira shaposhnikovii]
MDQGKAVKDFEIPARPDILTEIQRLRSLPDVALNQFADLIARDVGLSAGVLKMVNSPLFGRSRQITDIHNAVALLGIHSITQLVASQKLRQSITGRACISLEKFWDTATQTAQTMLLLRNHLNLHRTCPADDAYSFGLFRDCGIPIMAIKYPDYRSVLMAANQNPDRVFTEVEEDHYPTNHAVIGYYVASSWNLPQTMTQLILRHHDPSFLDDRQVGRSQKDLYAISKLAANILSQVKQGSDDCEWPAVSIRVLDHLGLTEYDHDVLQADLSEELILRHGIC